jgi:hypothetical protein
MSRIIAAYDDKYGFGFRVRQSKARVARAAQISPARLADARDRHAKLMAAIAIMLGL